MISPLEIDPEFDSDDFGGPDVHFGWIWIDSVGIFHFCHGILGIPGIPGILASLESPHSLDSGLPGIPGIPGNLRNLVTLRNPIFFFGRVVRIYTMSYRLEGMR